MSRSHGGDTRGSAATFAGAVVATGVAGLLARVCPGGCGTCGTCAVTVVPTAALVGSVGVMAIGTRLSRRRTAGTTNASPEHDQSFDSA